MNIETVNELIQSLESAGELSIRERKYLELAKAYQQLAAENVGLKAGVTYFAYSPEYGFDYFKDKQIAIDTAQEEIDAYREDADDGWSEDVQRVSWGVVIQQAQGFDAQGLHTSDSQHTYQTCNYRLVDSVATPATDRIVAEAEARGVEKAIAHLDKKFSNIGVQIMNLQWLADSLREGGPTNEQRRNDYCANGYQRKGTRN
ncbi:TPA: hypothetical protein OL609_002661 [Klebsiella oxytoca]|nr:hypothetical protein [Klebsiella oxytoca]